MARDVGNFCSHVVFFQQQVAIVQKCIHKGDGIMFKEICVNGILVKKHIQVFALPYMAVVQDPGDDVTVVSFRFTPYCSVRNISQAVLT